MTIRELKTNKTAPFEFEDEKLFKLFSFFLHSAPTIKSAHAANIPIDKLGRNWGIYIAVWIEKNYKYRIYSSNSKFPSQDVLSDYGLNDNSILNRKANAFICFREDEAPPETDCKCILRHIRNAIAHGYVFINNAGNRKYILMEDYNKAGNKRAVLLFSQAELSRLRKTIMM